MKYLLLDANIALVHLVGLTDPTRLGIAKKVKAYDQSCIGLLTDIINGFQKLVTTPNILTEVSNLIDAGRSEILPGIARHFEQYCALFDEIYVPSKGISGLQACHLFGLSDAVILDVSRQISKEGHDVTVLTDDGHLYHYLLGQDVHAINFSHLRMGSAFQDFI